MATYKNCNECEHFIYSCRKSNKNKNKYFPCYKCELSGEYAKDYLQKKRYDKFTKKGSQCEDETQEDDIELLKSIGVPFLDDGTPLGI